MKFRGLVWSLLLLGALTAAPLGAEKLMLAHVAINPAQGMLLLAKDSGILAKYGFSADVLLIPGTPRTIQALLAGDLDYVAAGAPASLRARAQGADVIVLSTLANFSSQRVVVKADSQLTAFKDLKGKLIGVTQFGSAGIRFYGARSERPVSRKTRLRSCKWAARPAWLKVWNPDASKSVCSATRPCSWCFAVW